MNKKVLLVSGTMVALMGLVTIIHAEEEHQAPNKKADRKAEILKKYDVDGDGVLSDAEKAAMRDQMKTERKGNADKGFEKGGRPTDEEILARFDTDGDGVLSDAEKAVMREEMSKRGGRDRGKEGAARAEIMKQFDTDGDGRLNDAEKAAMREKMGEHKQKSPEGEAAGEVQGEAADEVQGEGNGHLTYEEILAKYDVDGDGKLNKAERKAAREGSKKKTPEAAVE